MTHDPIPKSTYNWEIVEGIRKVMSWNHRERSVNEEGEIVTCIRGEGVIAKDIYDYVKKHKDEIT